MSSFIALVTEYITAKMNINSLIMTASTSTYCHIYIYLYAHIVQKDAVLFLPSFPKLQCDFMSQTANDTNRTSTFERRFPGEVERSSLSSLR